MYRCPKEEPCLCRRADGMKTGVDGWKWTESTDVWTCWRDGAWPMGWWFLDMDGWNTWQLTFSLFQNETKTSNSLSMWLKCFEQIIFQKYKNQKRSVESVFGLAETNSYSPTDKCELTLELPTTWCCLCPGLLFTSALSINPPSPPFGPNAGVRLAGASRRARLRLGGSSSLVYWRQTVLTVSSAPFKSPSPAPPSG